MNVHSHSAPFSACVQSRLNICLTFRGFGNVVCGKCGEGHTPALVSSLQRDKQRCSWRHRFASTCPLCILPNFCNIPLWVTMDYVQSSQASLTHILCTSALSQICNACLPVRLDGRTASHSLQPASAPLMINCSRYSCVQGELLGLHLFVCAHGSRDMRCGQIGNAVVNRLTELVGQWGYGGQVHVYRCSHVGGHKVT